ncbi:MAG: preprotein translocase subunit SecY [Myxococcales bacterium]|nr:preprotein translocase subunit SecY [Myxococcales bacterium]
MATSFANITKVPELQKRIVFTLALLAVYRVGVFVTVPFVNRAEMSRFIGGQDPNGGGGFLNLFNIFSGGALEQLSIFALGIMPYISASIILQLMTVVVPTLERLQKEGEQGRRKINQYTRYGTIGLSLVQSFGIALYLESLNDTNMGIVTDPGWGFRLMTVLTLTTGTAFIMWLGEQITERGIGNGISLIIMAGIIAYLPQSVVQTYQSFADGALSTFSIMLLVVLILGVIAVIVFFERAQRRIPVQYAKRMVGKKIYGGQSSYLPLKVNTAGVIPPIFAMSLLLFPTTVVGYFPEESWAIAIRNALVPGDWRYNTLYTILNVFFCYFYTAVTFNPVDVADNMKKVGGYVPGIRPGKKTAEYIDKVLTRITAAGAAYISAVCVLPFFLVDYLGVTFYFGGTGLLIVVGVALDTVNQIESHLVTRHYEGFTDGGGGGRQSLRNKDA